MARGAFAAFLSSAVSDSVEANHQPGPSARWTRYMTTFVGPDYTQEEMEEDARILGLRASERREVLTPAEAGAYAAGLRESEPEEK